MKKYIGEYLRSDLNLKEKWWHRLLVVLFLIGLISITYLSIINSLKIDRYRTVDTLKNRLTDEVVTAESLLKKGESIEYPGLEDMDASTYCSNKIWEHLDKVSELSGTKDYHKYLNGSYVKSPLDLHFDELKNSNTLCLTKDSSGDIKFLNNLSLRYNESTEILTQDHFTKISTTLIETLISLVSYLILIYIIYYKIFLYIAYGKKKS